MTTSSLLPTELSAWVERQTGATIVNVERPTAGASRDAWLIDIDCNENPALFLLQDKAGAGGSEKDASILRALAVTSVPVPRVLGLNTQLGAILMQRVEGKSDFPEAAAAEHRKAIAEHLLELTGQLHRINPAELATTHLDESDIKSGCLETQLRKIEDVLPLLGEDADPFFLFASRWLRAFAVAEPTHYALVHSDMGPGNFLFSADRVTAILDWEIAHLGDPMEDLAAIAVRDIATPIGNLASLFAHYEASSNIPVDKHRVAYYRALITVRNSLMISLGLAFLPPGFDAVDMNRYRVMLMRAAAFAILETSGLPLHQETTTAEISPSTQPMLSGMIRDIEDIVLPQLSPGHANRRAEGVLLGLKQMAHESSVKTTIEQAENDDLTELVGAPQENLHAALKLKITQASLDRDELLSLARYFGRSMQRLADTHKVLLGDLYHRLPQALL